MLVCYHGFCNRAQRPLRFQLISTEATWEKINSTLKYLNALPCHCCSQRLLKNILQTQNIRDILENAIISSLLPNVMFSLCATLLFPFCLKTSLSVYSTPYFPITVQTFRTETFDFGDIQFGKYFIMET